MTKKRSDTKSIYIIKNTINDKMYVGQTNNPVLRWQQHISNARHLRDNVIDTAIHDIGEKHFYYQILEEDISNYDEREQYWIQQYNTLIPNGYNVVKGGNSNGRGTENPHANIRDPLILEAIRQELKTTKTSFAKIAAKFGVGTDTIQGINSGRYYYSENIIYPIRESNRYSTEKVKQIMYALKYERDKSILQIAKEFQIDAGEVSNINQGKTHVINPNEKYPLRKGKPNALTDDKIVEIKELLKSDMPQKDIAKKYDISVNAVTHINLGLDYYDNNTKYPIRQNYQGNSKRNCFSPDELQNIEYDLKNTKMSMRNIAAKYETTITNIMNINNGAIVKYHKDDIEYPIRARKSW